MYEQIKRRIVDAGDTQTLINIRMMLLAPVDGLTLEQRLELGRLIVASIVLDA